MRPVKRSVLFATFVAITCGLASSSASAQDTPRSGGELVFVVPSEPPSYDGHAEGTFGVVHPLAPHYNTLLRIDPSDRTGTRPVADLAESWNISRDGLTYTLKLRQGVRFHDGTGMTSRDVKASYDRIVNPPPGVTSYRKGAYRAVEAVEPSSRRSPGYTLQFHRIVAHNSKVRGWTITPAHFLNQQLDTVWLAE